MVCQSNMDVHNRVTQSSCSYSSWILPCSWRGLGFIFARMPSDHSGVTSGGCFESQSPLNKAASYSSLPVGGRMGGWEPIGCYPSPSGGRWLVGSSPSLLSACCLPPSLPPRAFRARRRAHREEDSARCGADGARRLGQAATTGDAVNNTSRSDAENVVFPAAVLPLPALYQHRTDAVFWGVGWGEWNWFNGASCAVLILNALFDPMLWQVMRSSNVAQKAVLLVGWNFKLAIKG